MNLIVKKLKLHNFGSYKDTELELDSKGFCLVSGQNNYKGDNALSNGSGKSFLWSGICYALTGETIQGLKTGLKNIEVADPDMFVELEFSFDNNDFVVKRGINPAKFITIVKDGIDVSGKTYTESVTKLNELLPELTKDLIASCMIIGQGMPNKFSSFKPAQRKEILEKLTKSDFMINDIKERIAIRQTVLNTQLREYEDSLLVNTTQLTDVQRNITSIKNQLASAIKPNFDKEISDTEELCKKLNNEIEAQKAIKQAKSTDYDKVNVSLLSLTTSKQETFTEELMAYNGKKSSIETEKAVTEANILALQKEIANLKSITDVCPTCGQKIPDVHKPDTKPKEDELAGLMTKRDELQTKINNLVAKHNDNITNINASYAADLEKVNNELLDLKRCITNAETIISKAQIDFNNENEKLNRLKYNKETWDSQYNILLTNKTNAENKEIELKKNIDIISKYKIDTESHLSGLGKIENVIKRDFRGYLLSGIIAELNKYGKYCSAIVFGTDQLNLAVEGNDLEITYRNKPIDNLSGGEKQRVDLILQIAIRKLLQKYCGFNSNILVLDEITDFLDKQSCRAIMSLVEQELNTVESVFIISHHAEELEIAIDSEIKVIKDETGISSLA